MRHKIIRIMIIAAALLVAGCRKHEPVTLLSLDEALRMKETYNAYFLDRTATMRQIKSVQTDPKIIFDIDMNLAAEYQSWSMDSTLAYLNESRRIAETLLDDRCRMKVNLALAKTFAMTGYYLEAQEILSNIHEVQVPDEFKYEYYNTYHILSGELMAYTTSPQSHDAKKISRNRYREILLRMVPENTEEWCYLKYEEMEETGDMESAADYARQLVELCKPNSHEYAKACFQYQEALRQLGREDERFEWLIRSAIADAMCAVRDYASLNTLVEILFRKGDIERAFRYTSEYCMPDAIAYNGKLRPWQVTQFFPEVELAYQNERSARLKIRLWLIVTISSLFCILLLLFIYTIMRQKILVQTRNKLTAAYLQLEDRNEELVRSNEQLSALNAKMDESDKVKQEYIAQFLSILSENISTSRQYKNHVLKSIRKGETAALAKEIDSLPSIDEDIEQFYRMFDETFVNIYPDFVEKFNALLIEGAAVTPKDKDILTPEMRIFALIKLGITDSSKIASLLHYSANTIYNYRSKIKNRSKLERKDFEDAVRAI